MIEHITYYRIEIRPYGKVKRRWLNRYYSDSLTETDELFQQQFDIDPVKDKMIVRSIKVTKEQQAINRQNFLKHLESLKDTNLEEYNRITFGAVC